MKYLSYPLFFSEVVEKNTSGRRKGELSSLLLREIPSQSESIDERYARGDRAIPKTIVHEIAGASLRDLRPRLERLKMPYPQAAARDALQLAADAGLIPPADVTEAYDVLAWVFQRSVECPFEKGARPEKTETGRSPTFREKLALRFPACVRLPAEERGAYAEKCLDLYRKMYEKKSSSVRIRHLIYRPEWVTPADSDRFLPLSAVKTDWPGTRWTGVRPVVPCLPDPGSGYVKNRLRLAPELCGKLNNDQLVGFAGAEGDVRRGDVTLKLFRGTYFDFQDSCEVLVYETTHAARYRNGDDAFSLMVLEDSMPARNAVGDLFATSGRFAGIGVNAVTLLYRVRGESAPLMLLHHRGERSVAENAGTWSVIPAGSWTPIGEDEPDDFDALPVNTVYREFAEELLGVEEAEQLGVPQLLDGRLLRQPVVLLGFGFEPVSTKLELMAALQMDLADPDTRALLGGSMDRAELEAFFRSNYEGTLKLVPFTRPYLKQYRRDVRSAPVLKEILAILEEHFDHFAQLPEGSDCHPPRERV
ncbi:MAG: hypothetical protein IKH56_10245 [Oscillospiraceae bacterium]|nr:hypothetical protein [Oscillospiraceae bacterium]